jgi:hypothetical protein
LSKNFEAKKITKANIENLRLKEKALTNSAESVLELIVQNVFNLLNNHHEKDVQKFIVYLQNLYHMVNGDLNIFVDKFLSTFDLVKIYSTEEEKTLTNKIIKVNNNFIFYLET